MQEQTKIRKDLRSLTKDQSNYYFFLYKLLRIFAPDNVELYKFRAVISADGKNFVEVTPTCYYDMLISTHCTCCQHRNQFFPYWHRWLVGQFQKYLEKVDTKISQLDPTLIKVQAQRLLGIANKNTIKPVPSKQAIINSLTNIKKVYESIPLSAKANRAAHYWNVFDNTSTINYPKGFTEQIKELKELDILIQNIWGQNGLLQFNFKTRWYGDKIGQAIDKNGYLKVNNFQPIPSENDIKQLIKNDEFWKNPDQPRYSIQGENSNFLFTKRSGEINYFYNKSNRIQLRELLSQRKTITHNVYEAEDVNLLFAGLGRSFYSDPSGYIKKNRNQFAPIILYANALKTQPIQFMNLFCTTATTYLTSMENSHNFMHNNQGSMMNDASFSITNPIFFAYHSFIDLMLETKIQWINAGLRFWQQKPLPHPQDIQDGYKSAKTYLGLTFSPKSQFKQKWQKYMKRIRPNIPVYNKDYPIMAYINPRWRESQEISQQTFIAAQKKYSELIIDENRQKLNDLKTSFNADYDIKYTQRNDKFVSQLIAAMKTIPDSPQKLFVNLQLKYATAIKSNKSIITLRDSENNLIDLVTIGIFSKGLQKNCPNCPEFEIQHVNIPIPHSKSKQEEELISRIAITQALKSNRSEVTIYPQFNVYSNIYPEINNPQIALRIKTGRRIVNVIITKSQLELKGIISLSFIGQTENLYEKKNKIKAFKSQYKDFYISSQNNVFIRYDNKGKIVSEIEGVLICGNINIPFKYKFPLHSDYTNLQIKADKLSKINEKSSSFERASCFNEKPKGFRHSSKIISLSEIPESYQFEDPTEE